MLPLREVYNLDTLLQYCAEHLDWPVDEDYFDDVDALTYDFEAEDLGLKSEEFARIISLKQLRPLIDGQPWGIFSIEFEGKTMNVASLRRILSRLVPSARNADYKTWSCDHLLFLCFWGNHAYRTIGVVSFAKQDGMLPSLKIEYCTPKTENRAVLENFAVKLSGLKWPKSTNDSEWISQWQAVFTKGYRQTIRDTQQLTNVLANTARQIAESLQTTLGIETSYGPIHALYNRFNRALCIALSEKEFIDMYAQTIVYGLFSARCMKPAETTFSMGAAIDLIPKTNPLLRELLIECSQSEHGIDYDEFQLGELVSALSNADIVSILADFNRQTGEGREDPIVYFYEKFLDIYEKEQKKRRGVYFTPTPVVNFMVSSVLQILHDKFDCTQGFMDPNIVLLDPATGTGTFLRSIILETHKRFLATYMGHDSRQAWDTYVSESLLKRLYGFEFMMAPYAVAHMKLALTLKETGYTFSDEQRLQVYLANSLEHNQILSTNITSEDPLEKERAYAAVGTNKINIIMGNPPYRTDSVNQGNWIMSLMDDYKKEPGTNDRLRERNPKVVNDDYVKFIRLASEILKDKEDAIIAYVVPHSYTDNLTFRGMRWKLLETFDSIYVLDLHGNAMGNERGSNDERDENVFDIQQGISISFFIKKKKADRSLGRVYFAEYYGSRETKYEALRNATFNSVSWKEVTPVAPDYFFRPKDTTNLARYNNGVALNELFPHSLVGIKTADDENLISFTPYSTGHDQLIDYRPFDIRHINYDRTKVERDRYDVVKHFIGHENWGLVINRQVLTDNWSHIQIVRNMIDNRTHYSRRGNPYECPMLLFDSHGRAVPNVNRDLVHRFETAIGLPFCEEINDEKNSFGVLDLFDYCYAVLHSEQYRLIYLDLLSCNFPRVPLPGNAHQFWALVEIGAHLRLLHNMEMEIPNNANIGFVGVGDNCLSRVRHEDDKLFINRTQYFTNVRKELWDFCFGGYHGLSKWFKDRKDIYLSEADKEHVIQVFNIFDQTESIMGEIDALLIEFGML